MLNRKLNKLEFLFIIVLILILIIFTYILTNYHVQVARSTYVIKTPFVKKTIKCSNDAPKFLHDLMLYNISIQKSFNNQVAYIDKDGSLYHCESGWADGFNGNVSMTKDARYRLGSVTKVFTAASILTLINNKRISLDDKIVDILEFDESKLIDKRVADITVRMLLQHSAGFDRYKTFAPMFTNIDKPWCPTKLDKLQTLKLDYQPNTRFKYSNLGYCLLEAITTKVTEKDFRTSLIEILKLDSNKFQFINEGYLSDEIDYDFTYENMYGNWYVRDFDFAKSLSGTAGLSASAIDTVQTIKSLEKMSPFNLLSDSAIPCRIDVIDACYGLVLQPYQKNGYDFTIYSKAGRLPGVELDLFIDSEGGILAVFRGGTAPDSATRKELTTFVYDNLMAFYNMV